MSIPRRILRGIGHSNQVCGFLIGVAYLPGILSAASMPRWWAVSIGIPVLCRLDPIDLRPAIRWALFVMIGWGAVLAARSPVPLLSFFDLYTFTLLALAMVAGASNHADGIIVGILWGCAVSSAISIIQAAGIDTGAIGITETSSPSGLFQNREVLAETAAPLLVWAIVARRWVGATMMVIPLLLCSSRVAVFAACVGLLWAWRVPPFMRVVVGISAIAAGLGSIVLLGADKMASALSRLVLWGSSTMSLSWAGRGPGWWAETHPPGLTEFAHSDVLQAGTELGLASVGLWVIMYSAWSNADGDRAMRAAFVAGAVECAVSFPLHTPAAGFLIAVLAGHLCRDRSCVRIGKFAGRKGIVIAS